MGDLAAKMVATMFKIEVATLLNRIRVATLFAGKFDYPQNPKKTLRRIDPIGVATLIW